MRNLRSSSKSERIDYKLSSKQNKHFIAKNSSGNPRIDVVESLACNSANSLSHSESIKTSSVRAASETDFRMSDRDGAGVSPSKMLEALNLDEATNDELRELAAQAAVETQQLEAKLERARLMSELADAQAKAKALQSAIAKYDQDGFVSEGGTAAVRSSGKPRCSRHLEKDDADEEALVQHNKRAITNLFKTGAKKPSADSRNPHGRGDSSAATTSTDDGDTSSSEMSCGCKPGKCRCRRRYRRSSSKSKKRSGIKEKMSERVKAKQRYPQAALQPEFLKSSRSSKAVRYSDLNLGLFTAGELEIILAPGTTEQEGMRRLELLKATAYRSEYVPWKTLLHLHKSILAKLEMGRCNWSDSFKDIEASVLENPASKFDVSEDSEGEKKVNKAGKGAKPKKGTEKTDSDQVCWCSQYQKGTCPHAGKRHKAARVPACLTGP